MLFRGVWVYVAELSFEASCLDEFPCLLLSLVLVCDV